MSSSPEATSPERKKAKKKRKIPPLSVHRHETDSSGPSDEEEEPPSVETVIDTDDGLSPDLPSTRRDRSSKARNKARIDKTNTADRELIGKYMPEDVESIFAQKVRGEDDYFIPPSWLLRAVEEVSREDAPAPKKPDVLFDISEEALNHNSQLLEEANFDFERFLTDRDDTTLGYSSEFRPLEQLEKVLGPHPNFNFFREILKTGMPYQFTEELSEKERLEELHLQIERGNHKSAMESSDVAAALLLKDVAHGFSLPVHKSIVPSIKGAAVEPCGIA